MRDPPVVDGLDGNRVDVELFGLAVPPPEDETRILQNPKMLDLRRNSGIQQLGLAKGECLESYCVLSGGFHPK